MPASLEDSIADLVVAVSDGRIDRARLAAPGASLSEFGLSSVQFLTLIMQLEKTFGITIDPQEEPDFLDSVATIAAFVREQTGDELAGAA